MYGYEWKWKSVSHVCLFETPWIYSPWNSPGHNTGVGSLSLLQGTFPTQGLNPGLPHCRWVLYQRSHLGSPRILEWVAYPFSSRSSWPRNRTGIFCTAGGFFTNWATRVGLRRQESSEIWCGSFLAAREFPRVMSGKIIPIILGKGQRSRNWDTIHFLAFYG